MNEFDKWVSETFTPLLGTLPMVSTRSGGEQKINCHLVKSLAIAKVGENDPRIIELKRRMTINGIGGWMN